MATVGILLKMSVAQETPFVLYCFPTRKLQPQHQPHDDAPSNPGGSFHQCLQRKILSSEHTSFKVHLVSKPSSTPPLSFTSKTHSSYLSGTSIGTVTSTFIWNCINSTSRPDKPLRPRPHQIQRYFFSNSLLKMPKRDRAQDQETLLLLLVALIAPPISVFMMRGCGHEVVICVLLGFLLFVFLSPCSCSLYFTDPFCAISFIPGQIYAYYLVAEHYRKNKLNATGYSAQSTRSNVVQGQNASHTNTWIYGY